MTNLRTAAQQALEALEQDNPSGRTATITALRAALAEPVQEPIGVIRTLVQVHADGTETWREEPVWNATPQRKPLTEEEIEDCFHAARNAKLGASKDNSKHRLSVVEIARAIERAHGIGGKDE